MHASVFYLLMCGTGILTVTIAYVKGRGFVRWGAFGFFFGMMGAVCVNMLAEWNLQRYYDDLWIPGIMAIFFIAIPTTCVLLVPAIKRCPACVEVIRKDAIVCKHCGNELA
ncbi:MAG: hypothetical protein F4069_09520 [Rhodothermaceae bacterium]|nr:hypothetical protein [Rhodothermaceae bacterium]MYG69283.1 hypothetical protein [Rhodothermaceae bacterium]MYJ45545.1 hypothetical protein [Rhodothermaceae bacterium]